MIIDARTPEQKIESLQREIYELQANVLRHTIVHDRLYDLIKSNAKNIGLIAQLMGQQYGIEYTPTSTEETS